MDHFIPISLATSLASALTGVILYRFLTGGEKPAAPTKKEQEKNLASNESERGLMIIGRPEAPLIEFQPLAAAIVSESRGSYANLTATLGPIMELIPKAGEMASPAMRVVFSKEVMQGLKSGTLELAKDGAGDFLAVARKVDSKDFFAQGRLLKNGVKIATLASAALQVATLVTAQAHLAEITASLKKLEDRLEDISFFQKEEKRSELRGAVKLLRQYSAAIARGDLTEYEITALHQKLEDIELLGLSIGELGREMLLNEINKLGGIAVKEIIDASGTVERGANWASNCKDAIELITMAQSCRVLGCHVKSALPGDRNLIRERINDAEREVTSALQMLAATKGDYRKRIIEPLKVARKDWLLNPLGWDPFGRKDLSVSASSRYFKALEMAGHFEAGFDQLAGQVFEVVEQQEKIAENGLCLDVRKNAAGEVEILNLSNA